MLNAGILSSSSSLVLVPDLTGLDTLQANSLIQNLQFTPTTSTTTATGATSSNNGLIASQSLAPNTLAERYTTLSYVTYAYVAPPPPPPPPPSDPSYYWVSACCGTGNLKAEASSTVSFADALAIASSLCPVALSNVQQTYGPSAPSITCGSTPPPPPPEPPPGNVCGTACGNCIDFGGQWVFTSSTGSDGYCNYPPPPPPPSSVTCSFVGIVGASFFDCPSGQAEQYSCTNGVSYSNCI